MIALGFVLALSTVWDGVFTAEQAARGKDAYDVVCSACHGPTLAGGRARPLAGAKFWESWSEDSLSSLFDVMRSSMPEPAPRSLPDSAYVDILAYLLQRNEFPAGRTELTAESVKSIMVVGKDGPAPVPNFALVRVVGCLEERAPGAWLLKRSSEPARTRDPKPSQGEERARSLATPLGDQVFDLMDAYDEPAGQAGKKVEVKGILMRGPATRLNFSSFQVLDPACR